MKGLEVAFFVIAVWLLVVLVLSPRRDQLVYLFLLIATHVGLGYLFILWSFDTTTDSSNYSDWAASGIGGGLFGSHFVISAVRGLTHLGVDSYFTQVLFFASASAFAIAGLYLTVYKACLTHLGQRRSLQLKLLFLIPGLHFWTAPIGKDGLIAVAYSLVAFGLLSDHRFRTAAIALGIGLLVLVRPHVGVCASIAIALWFYTQHVNDLRPAMRGAVKVSLAALAVPLTYLAYAFLLSYVQQYSRGGFEGLLDFAQSRSDVYVDTDAGFSSGSYPYPVRYVLFFLGGIPWRVGGLIQFAALAEGVMILYLFLRCSYLSLMRWRARNTLRLNAEVIASFLTFYVAILASVLAMGATNFGLIARQRVMLYIPLILAIALFSFGKWSRRRAAASSVST